MTWEYCTNNLNWKKKKKKTENELISKAFSVKYFLKITVNHQRNDILVVMSLILTHCMAWSSFPVTKTNKHNITEIVLKAK